MGAGLVVFAYGAPFMPLVWAALLLLPRRRDDDHAAVPGLVVWGAAIGALPSLLRLDLFGAGGEFVWLLVAGAAAFRAHGLCAQGRAAGLGWASAAWLLLPSAPGLLGLALLGLLLGASRQGVAHTRLRASPLVLPLAALLGLGLLAAATLPSGAPPRLVAEERTGPGGLSRPGERDPGPAGQAITPPGSSWQMVPRDPPLAASPLPALPSGSPLAALFVLPLLWLGWRFAPLAWRFARLDRAGRGRLRVSRADLIMGSAALLLWAGLFVYAFGNSLGGVGPGRAPGLGLGRAVGEGGGIISVTPVVSGYFGALATLMVLLALVGVWALWRARLGNTPTNEASEPFPPPQPPPEPTERVRRAYRDALQRAAALGLGRGPGETPGEWAGRLSEGLPELYTLTELYEGVRYGLTPDEGAAREAEAASAALCRALDEYGEARREG